MERRAKTLLAEHNLDKSNLVNLEHSRKVASLSVFFRIHLGESAQELPHDGPPFCRCREGNNSRALCSGNKKKIKRNSIEVSWIVC